MSDMTVGGSIPNSDWTAALSGLAKSVGCGDVKLSGTVNEGKVTLTMTDNKTGVTASKTYTPELDPARFADDFDVAVAQTEAIKKIAQVKANFTSEEADDLVRTAEAAGEAGLVTEESTGYSKALFDIYSIIRLCKTTAQELKDTMRVAREADLQASIAQTHAEAAAQRDAALKGLHWTVGIALGAVALTSVMGGLGISKSAKAAKMRTSGPTGRASDKLDTILKGGNKKMAEANKMKKYKNLSAKEQEEMDAIFGPPETKAPKPNRAETEEMKGMSEMEERGPAVDERIEKFETHQKTLEKNTDDALADLEKAKVQSTDKSKAKGADKTKDKVVDEKDVEKCQAKYESCLRKEQYGRSVLTSEKATAGKTESLSNDALAAQKDLESISAAKNNSVEILDMERSAQKLNVASQSTMMMGNALGGIGGSVQALENAEASEIEADVKEADARHEEDNEVFSAAQQLIDEALSLAKSVNESLAQTNQNILA